MLVSKVHDLRFFECPRSCITSRTWQLLQMADDALDDDGTLQQMYRQGGLVDQPPWFIEACRIVKSERRGYRKRESDKAIDNA